MITIRNIEEMEKYYVEEMNTYVFKDDICLFCDINIKSNIDAGNIKARNIVAQNIHALDIRAKNIKARNIIAYNIKSDDIDAKDISLFEDIIAHFIYALNIDVAGNITAWHIGAKNINAYDINVRCNIDADNISYYAVCVAYDGIRCNSINGKRENSKHFVLDGELIIKGGN